jgi:hypothetical protein
LGVGFVEGTVFITAGGMLGCEDSNSWGRASPLNSSDASIE